MKLLHSWFKWNPPVLVFFWPVFDDPVVFASLRAVANQHHRVAQVVGVAVRLIKNSCLGNFILRYYLVVHMVAADKNSKDNNEIDHLFKKICLQTFAY